MSVHAYSRLLVAVAAVGVCAVARTALVVDAAGRAEQSGRDIHDHDAEDARSSAASAPRVRPPDASERELREGAGGSVQRPLHVLGPVRGRT